jgi:hypothetical protein
MTVTWVMLISLWAAVKRFGDYVNIPDHCPVLGPHPVLMGKPPRAHGSRQRGVGRGETKQVNARESSMNKAHMSFFTAYTSSSVRKLLAVVSLTVATLAVVLAIEHTLPFPSAPLAMPNGAPSIPYRDSSMPDITLTPTASDERESPTPTF